MHGRGGGGTCAHGHGRVAPASGPGLFADDYLHCDELRLRLRLRGRSIQSSAQYRECRWWPHAALDEHPRQSILISRLALAIRSITPHLKPNTLPGGHGRRNPARLGSALGRGVTD